MAGQGTVTSSTPDYTMGYSEEYLQFLTEERAREAVALLLPRLSDGMRILDVGSGLGYTAAVMAAAVPDGEVWGIDVESSQVEQARTNARRLEAPNAQFEVADALELPFGDESVDVVVCCDLLAYVPAVSSFLAEAGRVLRRGGLLFAREMIIGSSFAEPETECMKRGWESFADLLRADDGDPQIGRILGGVLSEAGFELECQLMTMETYAEPAELESFYRLVVGWFLSPEVMDAMQHYGVGLEAELRQLRSDMAAWRQAPGAVGAVAFGQAIATKP